MTQILVVEDDMEIVDCMKDAFKEVLLTGGFQMEVVYAHCANQAVDLLQKNAFDLVSIDGRFPNSVGGPMLLTAGIELIRKLESFGHKGRVVFYSANSDQLPGVSRITVNGQNVIAHDKVHFSVTNWALLCFQFVSQK
jgi:CheY-like chemotaxis protein